MDEISKLGDINSVNDFFDYKISIKTICVLIFIWCILCMIVTIIMFGGINNTMTYAGSIIESIKTTLLEVKENNTRSSVKTTDKASDKTSDKIDSD